MVGSSIAPSNRHKNKRLNTKKIEGKLLQFMIFIIQFVTAF